MDQKHIILEDKVTYFATHGTTRPGYNAIPGKLNFSRKLVIKVSCRKINQQSIKKNL